MATRAISIPGVRGRMRSLSSHRAGPVLLPAVGLSLATAAVVALALALASLPEVVEPPTEVVPAVSAPRIAPDTLDRLEGIGSSTLPRSDRPIGGLVFVRCTSLWVANADGSNAHRLLESSGLSSPTLSPDGRTIAFLAASPDGGQQVWAAAADGSDRRLLGSLTEEGMPVASARSLLWSPDGASLAFTTPAAPRTGRWAIWTLALAQGRITRLATGGPTPFWLDQQLLATDVGDHPVSALTGRRYAAERLSEAGDVVTIGISPGWWTAWDADTALLVRDGDGTLELQWRPRYHRRTQVTSSPPEGYRFDATTRPAVAEGAPVAVTLIDGEGERDLGLFDPLARRWTTLEYAWDPVWSPAPVVTGPIAAEEAARLARELIVALVWSPNDVDPGLLLDGALDVELAPFDRPGYAFGSPSRTGNGWTVPTTIYGRLGDGFAARDLEFLVRPVDGRLAASPAVVGPIVRLRTIDDAVAFLERVLTVEVIPPAGLPAGSRLAPQALEAWTWAGQTTGSLQLLVPGAGKVTFHYGSAGFGCGPSPIPLELETGTRAIATDPIESGGFNTVAWPATPRDFSAPFGVSGELPQSTLVAMASAMDRARRVAG